MRGFKGQVSLLPAVLLPEEREIDHEDPKVEAPVFKLITLDTRRKNDESQLTRNSIKELQ